VDGPGGRKYRAEQKLPRVDASGPAAETTRLAGWEAKDIDDLWDNEIRSGSGRTYGMELEESAQSGDIADQVGDLAEKIPVHEVIELNRVIHPRKAFIDGVLTPIQQATKATLKRIINFDPSSGQAWFNEDDAVMDELARMEANDAKANAGKKPGEPLQDSLKGLTLDQRATWTEHIIDGTFSSVSDDEEVAVVKIFETCPPAQRPLLYRMIEGHAWEGDYREGYFTWDDELYNSLSGDELDRVRDLINQGM
jgi:hypothetical protein